MPLRKEDLKRAKIWTWADLNFFLFQLATKTDGTKFPMVEWKMVVEGEYQRIKKLLRGWVHNGEIKPIDPTLDLVRDFEKLEFKRDDIIRLFKENRIFESIKENGVAIEPKKLKDFEQLMNKLPDQDSEKHGFPQIDKWSQLTLCRLEGGQMEVSVAGETFSEDKLKAIMPNYLYTLLFHIVARGRPFDNDSIANKVLIKGYIPRLRECLRKGFKVNEDPIPYNTKAKVYEIKFKCESDIPEKSFSPEDATPSGVPRKIERPDEHL